MAGASTLGSLNIAFTETSYQTAPLGDYTAALRDRATDLFRRLEARVGTRAKQHKGSFSIIANTSDATAAKIMIYETGKGKINGPDPKLSDGIYILIRLPGTATGRTIGVAPMHHERFAYFTLTPTQDLDEMADFMAACAGVQ